MRQNNDFYAGVDPEEVFLDSSLVPQFAHDAFEGRIVRGLSSWEVRFVGIIFSALLCIFGYKLFSLQVLSGATYAKISEENTLIHSVLFAKRGLITDRNGVELAWNEYATSTATDTHPTTETYASRRYISDSGLAHLLGFVNYPEYDTAGRWWRTEFAPQGGVEESYDGTLAGVNGSTLIERSALGEVVSSGKVIPPIDGKTVRLSIDSELNTQLFTAIANGARRNRFGGGAGVIIDVHTGEVLALTSYPEVDNNILTEGIDHERIAAYNTASNKPFLNRAIQGTYTPGSIIKPFIGSAALHEGVISPEKKLLSTGVLKVPNPYSPGKYTAFRDWTTTIGWVDMRDAIKMSSSIYFYIVGGGYGEQRGLGISKIDAWAQRFGFGQTTGIALSGEKSGLVPTPEWQKEVFGQDTEWTLGNTYHTSIGQYGWLVTPIQAGRYIASVANGGTLYTPHLVANEAPVATEVGISTEALAVVREGMRRGAQSGTARALNVPGISIAAKTGTAQLGVHNEYMNSWVVGFWPYEDPQFAFAVVLEKAPAETLIGAAPAMSHFFSWLVSKHGDDYAAGVYPVASDTHTPESR